MRVSRWFDGVLALVAGRRRGRRQRCGERLALAVFAHRRGRDLYGLAWLQVVRLNRRLGLRKMLMPSLPGKRFRDGLFSLPDVAMAARDYWIESIG